MSEDGDAVRYIEINGRKWRKSDPRIPESLRKELVTELMSARRAVQAALRNDDVAVEQLARTRVHDAKIALGERGQPWWEAPTVAAIKDRIAASIRTLVRNRGVEKSICPSDVARVCGGDSWRELMEVVREEALNLAEMGWLEIIQSGNAAYPPFSGPIRFRRKN